MHNRLSVDILQRPIRSAVSLLQQMGEMHRMNSLPLNQTAVQVLSFIHCLGICTVESILCLIACVRPGMTLVTGS